MAHERIGKPFLESTFFGNVTRHYARVEGPISSISLLGGFAFDAFTLKRVDAFWENFWVVVHLLVVGACILLVNRAASRGADASTPRNKQFWLVNALQFFFGGLLSTFLVFYFRSGTLRASWPFFVILAAAFLANEKLKRHYARLDFQLSLFFLSIFCFSIFLLPVILHRMSAVIFLLSGVLSLALLFVFLRMLRRVAGTDFEMGRTSLIASIAGIFLTINLLYFLNLIPPIPLSLQDVSVCHAITRTADGNFAVQAESRGVVRFFQLTETYHAAAGAPVFAYSAVFSPTALNTRIVHEWQFYEPKRGWSTMSRVELPVRGGRENGYRTYSMRTSILPGAWRVNVKTPSGAMLGRLRFNVVMQESAPTLTTVIKN